MKKLRRTTLGVALTSFLALAGCSMTTQQYQASFQNINKLNQFKHSSKNSVKVAVPRFTSLIPPKKSILCRLDSMVTLPQNQTYAGYIHNALLQELMFANLYDSSSRNVLYGQVDRISFSSMIGAGKWDIMMTFRINNGRPFTVENVYRFSANFVADTACNEVAEAYEPAVQTFLLKLYNTPQMSRYFHVNNILTRKP